LALALTLGACAPADQEQAKKSVEQIKEETKDVAADAAEKTKKAAADAADKGKELLSRTGEVITDAWITTKVKAKFVDEKLLKASDINVDTRDRVVTLKGTVASEAAKKRAVMVTDGTEGVLRVVDELAIKAR
jgi:hyperosmotically inducible protein